MKVYHTTATHVSTVSIHRISDEAPNLGFIHRVTFLIQYIVTQGARYGCVQEPSKVTPNATRSIDRKAASLPHRFDIMIQICDVGQG